MHLALVEVGNNINAVVENKMRLKHYQEKVIKALKDYLGELDIARNEYEEMLAIKPNLAKHINFPKDAWEKSTGKTIYHPKTNSLNEPLPDIYLKVPTGGGKTLLPCHSIDLIQKTYLKKQAGLVLWIVPSEPIYKQTINRLKDRQDPYRQLLDISSGGKTLIKEKTELFNIGDVEENLIVLMLMLPSAWRVNKETLKLFRDRGGFTDFFPREDDFAGHKKLKQLIPNLDCFSSEADFFFNPDKNIIGECTQATKTSYSCR